MAPELTRPYQLRTSDFDRFGRIQPAAVLDIFQDVASIQAEDIGIGFDDMQAQGVFWAIVRAKYEVLRQPIVHSTVLVRTWPHSPSRFAFQRDYSMADESGDFLVKGSSEWVLMDVASRKLAPVLEHYSGPRDFCEDRAFPRKLRKIHDLTEEDEAVQSERLIVPGASDIDVNGHVNNARYAAYVLDALDELGLAPSESVRTFQMDFRHEVRAGEKLRVAVARIGDTGAFAKGTGLSGEASFACSIGL